MRRLLSFRSLALLVAMAAFAGLAPYAAELPKVQLNADKAAPREVEESTQSAVLRDYGRAWQGLATALEQNRPDALEYGFIGIAHDKAMSALQDQRPSGLRTRYIDHGHKLEAVFYSQEGSALEMHDTAQLEIQLLDGDTVVYSEPATVHYTVVMTPAVDHWQVRLLQAVPGF